MKELDLFTSRLDAYSRRARLAPALLVVLGPIALLVGVGLDRNPAVTAILGILGACGFPIALADWVRRRGQDLQTELWRRWNGNPVAVKLREQGPVADRRRSRLASATSLQLDNPSHGSFDEAIEYAIRRLITATRDPGRFRLVFEENCNYGFARNMLAVRVAGMVSSTVSLVGAVALSVVSLVTDQFGALAALISFAVALGALAFWRWYPTEGRVKASAVDYRDRLLEALDDGAMEVLPRQATSIDQSQTTT